MPFPIEDKLVIAVASSALFDLSESDAVYREALQNRDLRPYVEYMRENEDVPFETGSAFPFVRRLLSLNEHLPGDPVEVVILSRNSADTGLRVMNSIRHYSLGISRGSFLDGGSPWPYIKSFSAALFLSGNGADVREANDHDLPAGMVNVTGFQDDEDDKELRIAFDFDGVLANDEAEGVYQREGLETFRELETKLRNIPHPPGPLRPLLEKLRRLQEVEQALWKADPDYKPRIKTAIVTARGAPSHERAIKTLRAWGLEGDKAFFLGGMEKERVLAEFRPHLFFDDQIGHLTDLVPSVHIPYGELNRREGARNRDS